MNRQPIRVVFMGTPDFSVPALQALLEKSYQVVCVYTQPPRPARRGQKLEKSAVHNFALKKNLLVHTPTSLSTEEERNFFRDLQPDVVVVVAYGMLLPSYFIQFPAYGCLNIHASLLPRWRGAAPIQRCLMAGDSETGVCLMRMDEGLDTGPVISSAFLKIAQEDTASDLFHKLSDLGGALLKRDLHDYLEGELPEKKQSDQGVTYAKKILKEEGCLDFSETATQLERKVRGLFPHPGAYFIYKGMRIKIKKARAIVCKSHISEQWGTIKDGQLGIYCRESILYPLILQKPGGKDLDLGSFLNGFSFQIGHKLNQDV